VHDGAGDKLCKKFTEHVNAMGLTRGCFAKWFALFWDEKMPDDFEQQFPRWPVKFGDKELDDEDLVLHVAFDLKELPISKLKLREYSEQEKLAYAQRFRD